MKLPYTIIILWSDEDNSYLVHLPEFPSQKFHTHGNSYEEAVENAREVLELLVEEYHQEGKSLSKPKSVEETLQLTETFQ
ncbi:MAG: type II toxin-antitoxin system HicB family antitoxin [Okeania sp. SIO2D1]|nr:type II toxin-antitoxin system HicB family antitoxin [Okeania sp. SIO2D1]